MREEVREGVREVEKGEGGVISVPMREWRERERGERRGVTRVPKREWRERERREEREEVI